MKNLNVTKKSPNVIDNNANNNLKSSNIDPIFETLFSFKVSNLDKKNQEEFIYYPSAEKGIDKTYTSYVKFIPNIKNPSKSLTRKWVVMLENPLYDEKRYIDCPSSVNEFSILQQTFFVLYNSQDPFIREKANYFKRREVFYSYIYIVNDEIDKSYNDKILIFRFGRQIYDILSSAENDSISPIQIYNIFAPYIFKINVIEKSGYNHYSRSKFIEKYFPVKINNIEITKQNYKILMDYINSLNYSPDMYEYKPWDKETTEYVLETIYTIVDDIKLLRKIFRNFKEINGVPVNFEKAVIDIDGFKDKDYNNDDDIILANDSTVKSIKNQSFSNYKSPKNSYNSSDDFDNDNENYNDYQEEDEDYNDDRSYSSYEDNDSNYDDELTNNYNYEDENSNEIEDEYEYENNNEEEEVEIKKNNIKENSNKTKLLQNQTMVKKQSDKNKQTNISKPTVNKEKNVTQASSTNTDDDNDIWNQFIKKYQNKS